MEFEHLKLSMRRMTYHVVMSHHELGVDENVSAEDQSGDDAVAELDCAALGEESGHETEDDQDPEGTEEVRHLEIAVSVNKSPSLETRETLGLPMK
jgi:hypothetical protein